MSYYSNLKSVSDYQWDAPENFEHPDPVSLTVPDEARSVRELYDLWQRGQLQSVVGYLPGTYDDGVEDPLNQPNLDFVDMYEATQLATESILSEEAKKREVEAAEAEERKNAEIERLVLQREAERASGSSID